jgi:DNA (cytosine-5)-methyltransferase 1
VGDVLRIGSLFSGIGGLELGLEWAGVGRTVWQVEQDPYCRAVLARHWPDAERHDDVRTASRATLAPVDVICGGFPCQDISGANATGRGLDGERSGLWFEYLRVVDELRPRAVVVENVARLVRRGLDTVVGGLVDLGYAVEGTRLRAGDVGAPHRRERLFLVAWRVADADGQGQRQPRGAVADLGGRTRDGGAGVADGTRLGWAVAGGERDGGRVAAAVGGGSGGVGDPDREGRPAGGGLGRPAGTPAVGAGSGAAQPGVGGDADGLPGGLDGACWPAGRGPYQHPWEPARTVAGRSVADRGARVKALGNAVVPHCAYVVGLRVRERLAEAA